MRLISVLTKRRQENYTPRNSYYPEVFEIRVVI